MIDSIDYRTDCDLNAINGWFLFASTPCPAILHVAEKTTLSHWYIWAPREQRRKLATPNQRTHSQLHLETFANTKNSTSLEFISMLTNLLPTHKQTPFCPSA